MNAAATNALAVPAPASQPAYLPAKPGILPESSIDHTMSNRGVSPLTLAEFMVAALDKSAPDGTETIKKKMELADAESWKQEMMAAKEQYMEEILKNIDMQNCWSVSTKLLGF